MKPVTVSVTVPNDREEVYAFLDVLANHEPFTDHMMVDWTYSGLAERRRPIRVTANGI
jgi:hypothetical protein